jgi:hypothetical protein
MIDDPANLSPEEQAAAMAGDAGGETQFEAMKSYLPEYIDVIMARLRPRGGGRVAVTEDLKGTYVQEVGA